MRSNLARLLKVKNKRPYIIDDYINIIKYGFSAPKYGEIIWVNPKDCRKYLALTVFRERYNLTRHSAKARVIEHAWPVKEALIINELPLFKNCIAHWVHDVPWEQTGEYERMEKLISDSREKVSHGCMNKEDIIKRCENLDKIFEEVKKEGRLRKSEEVSSKLDWGAREMLIHIGPKGELYKGGEGMHRFAIAYILDAPFPAEIGCVHVSALPYLNELRQADYKDIK